MYVEFDVEKRLGDFRVKARGRLERGLTCIVGTNGAGKTTLMKILAGLLKPDRGAVNYVGIRSKIYVGELSAPPDAPAIDVLLAGRTRFSSRPVSRRDVEAAAKYLEPLGLRGLEERRWGTLSAGERQRFVIAAAMAAEADFLLLDEPLANLHGDWRDRAMEVLKTYAAGKIAAISTHHFDVLPCCHRVMVVREGTIAWEGPPDEMDEALYTRPACFPKGKETGVVK